MAKKVHTNKKVVAKLSTRTPSLNALRKKAWRLMSLYVRQSESDQHGYVRCVSCGAYSRWESMHGGHYIHAGSRGRDKNAVSYDFRNIHSQCLPCNYFDQDDAKHKYSIFMRNKYGEGIDDELRAIKRNSNLRYEDFERIVMDLESKLEQLDGRKAA